MPVQAKADGNVPFTPGRARYSLIGVNPTLLQHVGTLDGQLPATSSVAAANLDPVVSGGKAVWGSSGTPLSHGGLFPFSGRAIVVEALIGSGAFTIVDSAGAVTRPTPTTFPFTLSPAEQIKCVGGSTAGVVARLAGQKVL